MRNNLSLHGMRDYANSKKGIPSESHEYRDLRDLDVLVTKMIAIRNNQSTEGCQSHGLQVGFGQVKTKCSGHSSSYTSGDWSLGKIRLAIDGMKSCTCDSHSEYINQCPSNAPRV